MPAQLAFWRTIIYPHNTYLLTYLLTSLVLGNILSRCQRYIMEKGCKEMESPTFLLTGDASTNIFAETSRQSTAQSFSCLLT